MTQDFYNKLLHSCIALIFFLSLSVMSVQASEGVDYSPFLRFVEPQTEVAFVPSMIRMHQQPVAVSSTLDLALATPTHTHGSDALVLRV